MSKDEPETVDPNVTVHAHGTRYRACSRSVLLERLEGLHATCDGLKQKLEAAERELEEWRTGKRRIHYPATVYAYWGNANDLGRYRLKVCAKCGVIAPCPIHPQDSKPQ
jgi:hypothetical protein